MPKILEIECAYQTERLRVTGFVDYINNQVNADRLINQIPEILSPNVTRALPTNWQDIHSQSDAANWLDTVLAESSFFIIQLNSTEAVIGFLFLYEPDNRRQPMDVRLGYLLKENEWGKGFGSELIEGLISKSKMSGLMSSLTGGVEADNTGSIKILVKNGFVEAKSDNENTLFFVYNFDY